MFIIMTIIIVYIICNYGKVLGIMMHFLYGKTQILRYHINYRYTTDIISKQRIIKYRQYYTT